MASFPNVEKFTDDEIYFMADRASEALIDAKSLIIQLAGQDGIDDEKLFNDFLNLISIIHDLRKIKAKI